MKPRSLKPRIRYVADYGVWTITFYVPNARDPMELFATSLIDAVASLCREYRKENVAR